MLMLILAVIGLDPSAAEWEKMQIDWIVSTKQVRDLDQVLPRHEAALIRLLDSGDYTTRELAQAELVRMGDKAYIALSWGTHCKQVSVFTTCDILRGRLFHCRACHGTGECQACVDSPPDDYWGYRRCTEGCDWARRCIECDGSGDSRRERVSYLENDDSPRFVAKDLWGLKHARK